MKDSQETIDAELREIERMESECSCELPDLHEVPTQGMAVAGSVRHRALRLLLCDDPPRGENKDLCLLILGGEEGNP